MKPKQRKPAASAAQMPKTAEFIAEMMQKVSQFDSDSEGEAQSPSKAFLGTDGLIPKLQSQKQQEDYGVADQQAEKAINKVINSILSPTIFQQQKQVQGGQANDTALEQRGVPQQKTDGQFGRAFQAKPASKASALANEVEFLGQRSRVECAQQPQVLELSGGEDEFSDVCEEIGGTFAVHNEQKTAVCEVSASPVKERQELVRNDKDYLESLFAMDQDQSGQVAQLSKYKQRKQSVSDEEAMDDDALVMVRARLQAPKQPIERRQETPQWHDAFQMQHEDSSERMVPQKQQKLVEEKVFKTLQRAPKEKEQQYFLAASLQKSTIDKLNAVIALQYAPLFPTPQDMQQAVRALYKLPVKLFIDCETAPFADVELSVDERQLAAKKFVLLAKIGRKNIKIECKRIKSNDSSVRFQRCQTSLRSGQVALVLDNTEQQEWILCVDGLQAERIGESIVCLVRGVQNLGEMGI